MTNNNHIQAQHIAQGDIIEDKAGKLHEIVEVRDLPHSGRTRLVDAEGNRMNPRHQEIFFLATS